MEGNALHLSLVVSFFYGPVSFVTLTLVFVLEEIAEEVLLCFAMVSSKCRVACQRHPAVVVCHGSRHDTVGSLD